DSLNCNSTAIDPGVVVVQEGLDSLNALIDSVQVLLLNQPFAPLGLELAWMDSLQNGIDEFDAILAGKTYTIGPESENKVIRPRGILESLAHPDGPMGVFKDFYRAGEDPNYTFYNTFPQGITTEMYAMITSDIILNDYDTREEFEDHIHTYQANLKAKPDLTPDEHFGLALTLLYDLNEEFFRNVDDAIRIISEGRIDSLVDTYDWSDFDVQDQIDEIRYHVNHYIESEEPTNFVILNKEYGYSQNPYVDPNPYVLDANSEFSLAFLAVPQVKIATATIEMLCEDLSKINNVLKGFSNELDQMFILDLDPNYLDFSEVEGPIDVISILEQSNPEFLTVTDYGVEKFHEMGDKLENSFNSFAIFFDNLTELFQAVEPYQENFGIDIAQMHWISIMFSERAWSLYHDFETPELTTIINSERVNVSAWFDNPPTSFLVMVKNFFMGADSTLGGMFPDRYKVGIDQENKVLPTEFKLYPVYPNPFNPVATITFDLPQAADVKLSIIDLQGRVIEQIVNQKVSAGQISFYWNASQYPSGIYFALLEVNGHQNICKMTLLK
ncbi:MAG: T9SS type A sorting domain-containing protein, partial [Candidatus Marinimicrobia bacterium]|nr:T9SS type A sorting domain-containing protein [Candidatus Neomarinimicrobiota bacterium]